MMKHLKTPLAILLTFALLAGTLALAEELPYMQQLGQDRYSSTMFLTTDSYPEVCIGPTYFEGVYISQYEEPVFVHFPCPPNTYAVAFDATSCSFIDASYGRQYLYTVHESAAYETFVNEAEKDEYIVSDGAGDVASYLEPDRCRAHALIAAKDIDKSAKVEILIYDDSLDGKSEAQIIESLSAQITEEAARVQASMRVDTMPAYWTQGRYAGFKQICDVDNTDALILTYTLPEGYFISKMDAYGAFSIAKINGKDDGIIVDVSFDTNSYVAYKMEEEPEHVTTAEIDGAQYRIYSNWYNEQEILSAYADRVLSENAGFNASQELVLLFELDPAGSASWASVEEVEAELAKIAAGVQLDFGQSIPDYRDAASYAAAPAVDSPAADAPAPDAPAADAPAADAPAVDAPAQDAPAGDEAWVCAECGNENNGGKFCPNCGSPRPEEPAALVCSNCGYVVPEGETPKFCAECGNPF